MSLTKEELSLISKNYKNYKTEYEATKSMPRVLAHVRELEAKIAELEKKGASNKVKARVGVMEVQIDAGKDGLLGTKDDKVTVGRAKPKKEPGARSRSRKK